MKRIVVPLATAITLFVLPTSAHAAKPVKTIKFATTGVFFANETDVGAVITMTRSWSTGTASVRLSTSLGTASASTDYTPLTNLLVTFASKSTTATAMVLLLDDGVYDEVTDETVNLALSSPSKGATLASPSTGVLNIVDNDPPAPPVVTAASGTLDGTIDLSWPAVLGANNYHVWRGTTSGAYGDGPFPTGGATTATDSGLTPGTTYYYVVYSSSGYGISAASQEASAQATGTPPPPTELLTNGDFETGDLTGWTTDTANSDPFTCGPNSDEACYVAPADAVVTSAVAHGGTYSAFLGNDTGSSAEPCGDSYLYQSFTVPSTGTTTLSFWHLDSTTDTVTYDQIHVYLVDTATDITVATPLYVADTADWAETTADLTGFAGLNLRLVVRVHQDCASDPTSVYVDDVSVANTA